MLSHLYSGLAITVFSFFTIKVQMKLNFSIGPLVAVIICVMLRLIFHNAMNDVQKQKRLSTPVTIKGRHKESDTTKAVTHLLDYSLPH